METPEFATQRTGRAVEGAADRPAVPAWLTLLIATACGLTAANLYYAQPLIGPIASALGLSAAAAGSIVALTQLGYGTGLLFIVPLGDIVENRRLVLSLVAVTTMALAAAALSTHPLPFLAAALFIGIGSVAVQVLVAYAAHVAPDASRGRVIGNVMSGLMLGIMLARPVSSFVAQLSSWHAIFFLAASIMFVLAFVLGRALPKRAPTATLHYGALLRSMVRLAATTPVLQRRALYHAFLFAAFSLFWTTSPLLLAGPLFHFSQGGIALFALAGVAGAVVAPLAGRLADSGHTRVATGLAMAAVGIAFLATLASKPGSHENLALLVGAAILLDAGVTMNLVLSQRAIFALGAEFRSRLNGLFMATFFVAGAAGSAVGGWAYARGGWPLAACFGFALPLVAFACYATEIGRVARERPQRGNDRHVAAQPSNSTKRRR